MDKTIHMYRQTSLTIYTLIEWNDLNLSFMQMIEKYLNIAINVFVR